MDNCSGHNFYFETTELFDKSLRKTQSCLNFIKLYLAQYILGQACTHFYLGSKFLRD